MDAGATKVLFGLDREGLRTLTGFLTGHCAVRAFTSRWDRDIPDFCRLCEDVEELETVEHIMCHCPRLQGLTTETARR